ncbi:MerC domain-containing protein [Ferrovibrio xuzhouensis]|uniref:MerC domain-containing protein n=1 Tax=Ferrovibrio xuzhouensis TaxID=1576914 RepID=A0ABV7VAS3_9PROT
MPSVELVYENTCPNVEAARARLAEAFRAAGIAPVWSEWEVGNPQAPEHVRRFGSPTILVNGKDIVASPDEDAGSCCRIYALNGDERGVPPLDAVVAALVVSSKSAEQPRSFRLNAAVLPVVGAALLPKLSCPVCWPAYAGLLSSFGIGFVDYTPYLLPLTVVFVSVSVLALAWRAPNRRGYGPFWLGAMAAAAILIGKFGFDNDVAMYAGVALLAAASAWNTWPRRSSMKLEVVSSCPACSE